MALGARRAPATASSVLNSAALAAVAPTCSQGQSEAVEGHLVSVAQRSEALLQAAWPQVRQGQVRQGQVLVACLHLLPPRSSPRSRTS